MSTSSSSNGEGAISSISESNASRPSSSCSSLASTGKGSPRAAAVPAKAPLGAGGAGHVEDQGTWVEILYADDCLAAVSKPSGLSVHRGWDRSRDNAMARVRDALGRYVWPVHRLDRPASGVLLFALDRDTARAMYDKFAQGGVHKRYLALVRGNAPEGGIIDRPLRRTADGPRVPSETRYRRVCAIDRPDLERIYSLMEVWPRTGRPHQIRRHFQHISHPLIGDVRYGRGEHNRLFRERFGLQRLFLHACAVTFEHPVTTCTLTIAAPLSDDLRAVLDALGCEAG